jgi:hypothetical protein
MRRSLTRCRFVLVTQRPRLQAAQCNSNPNVAEISEPVRDKVMDWNRYDLALVQRARARLSRWIAAYPGHFQKDLVLFCKLNALYQQGVPVGESPCLG